MSKSIKKNIQLENELVLKNERIKQEKLSAIGQFAANMAHDIRNPLYAIKNSTQIINKRILDKIGQKEIQRINRSISRIDHQITQVLDFVRQTPLQIEQISFCHVIKGIVNSMSVPENITNNYNSMFILSWYEYY